MTELIHVAAGVLIDAQGRVLLARRHDDAHQGGLWEFPGGKCEPNEPVERALARELHEELGIELLSHRPLIRIAHHYADRSVLLDVHRVDRWQGEPHGREGQPLAWVEPGQLGDYPMPAADKPIVQAIRLPDRYLITPPEVADEAQFLQRLEQALASGIRLLQFRVFDLTRERWSALATQAAALCTQHRAQLMLNADPRSGIDLGAAGLHLSSALLHQIDRRPPGVGLLAASCHTAKDLAQAQRIGADLAVLSPVLPTRSHPDATPLGWERFSQLVDEAAIPVYALGGMRAELLPQAWQAGAQGVAGIRGLWPDESD